MLGGLCGTAAPSAAAPVETTVRLEYQAPGGCPTQAEFWQRVQRANTRLRAGDAEAAARAYRVTIRAASGGFEGELLEVGQAAPRSLDAARCAELADALALMLALSADAPLSQAPTSEVATATAPTPEAASPKPEAASPKPEAASPKPEAPLAVVRPPVASRPPSVTAGEPDSFLWAGPSLLLGAVPDALVGATLAYDRVLGRHLAARGSLRGALADGAVSGRHAAIAPELCARLAGAEGELRGCAGVALGLLWVKGVEYQGNQSEYWLAPLFGLRIRRKVVGLFWLELGAELELPQVRRSYFVKRRDENFATPKLAGELELLSGVAL